MEELPKKFSRRILKNPVPLGGPFEFLADFEDGSGKEHRGGC